jgi:hypothetical protein
MLRANQSGPSRREIHAHLHALLRPATSPAQQTAQPSQPAPSGAGTSIPEVFNAKDTLDGQHQHV